MKIVVWVLILPAMMICRQDAALATVETSVRDVELDICGNNREVIVVVEAGQITDSDSILGYDVTVRFDPAKLRITQGLSIGTISETLDHDVIFDLRTNGEANAQGFNVLRFIRNAEKRPLVAFLGEYVGPDCPDSLELDLVDVSYGKLFSDGVTIIETDGVVTGSARLAAGVEDKPERRIELESSLGDEIVFPKGNEQSRQIDLGLKNSGGNRVSLYEFSLTIDNDQQFALRSIEPASDDVSLDSIDEIVPGKEYRVSCTITGDADVESDFVLLHIQTTANTDDKATLVLRPIQVNDCACVSRLLESSLVLKSVKDTVTTVVDDGLHTPATAIRLTSDERYWHIHGSTGGPGIRSLALSSLDGRQMFGNRYLTMQRHIRIPHDKYAHGVYFLRVELSNGNYLTMNISK